MIAGSNGEAALPRKRAFFIGAVSDRLTASRSSKPSESPDESKAKVYRSREVEFVWKSEVVQERK